MKAKEAANGPGGATAGAADAVASDPVLSRLELGAELSRKIGQILAGHQARLAECLRSEAQEPERSARLQKLDDATRALVREALGEDRRRRFDAGLAVVAESRGRQLEALRELARASAEAKGDAAGLKAAREACAAKLEAARVDRERLLDERVGRAERPGAQP